MIAAVAIGQPAPQTKATAETAHLSITTSVRDAAAGGRSGRVALLVDVAPKPKIHVYAPGEKDAIAVSLTIAPEDGVKADAPEFPAAEKFYFEPLKLTQLVYSKPFQISQPVMIAPALRDRARAAGGTLTVKGTLRYQACDDKVCYVPKNVPVSWTVAVH